MLTGPACVAVIYTGGFLRLPARPAGRRDQHQRDAQGRGHAVGMREDHGQARSREEQRAPLVATHALAPDQNGQTHREEHLRLHHQRGQPRRDVALHRDVEQAELPHADQYAIQAEVLPAAGRARNEEQRRHQRQGKAQRGEQQRRNVFQRVGHQHEIAAPHRHQRDGEQEMAEFEHLGHRT